MKTKIFDHLPDETWVYPGHGNDTTPGAERPTWKSGAPAAGKPPRTSQADRSRNPTAGPRDRTRNPAAPEQIECAIDYSLTWANAQSTRLPADRKRNRLAG